EIRSLPAFLQQIAAQTKCAVCLLHTDGTSVCYGSIAKEGSYSDCCLTVRPMDIVSHWQNDNSHTELWEQTCPSGSAVLLRPICWSGCIVGVLAACSLAPEHHPLLSSVAGMISEYVSLARAGVHEWVKSSSMWSAHEKLHKITQSLEETGDICRNSLGV